LHLTIEELPDVPGLPRDAMIVNFVIQIGEEEIGLRERIFVEIFASIFQEICARKLLEAVYFLDREQEFRNLVLRTVFSRDFGWKFLRPDELLKKSYANRITDFRVCTVS
jgi:hypothetical protein